MVASNSFVPISFNRRVAAIDAGESSGCMSIHAMPDALQSVFKKTGFAGLNLTSRGDEVFIHLISWNNSINWGLHAMRGMSFLKYFLYNNLIGFNGG